MINKLILDINNNPKFLRNNLNDIKREYKLLHLSNIDISKLIIKFILNSKNIIRFEFHPRIKVGKLSVFFAKKILNENPLQGSYIDIYNILENFGYETLNNSDNQDWIKEQKKFNNDKIRKVFKNKYSSGRNMKNNDYIFHGLLSNNCGNYKHITFHIDEINEKYFIENDFDSITFPLLIQLS